MRFTSKSGVLAVAALLAGAAVFASACGGSDGDRTGGGGSGNTGNTPGAGAPGTAGTTANGGASTAGASGAGTGGGAACDSATACCATTKCTCPYPAGAAANMVIADMEDGKTMFKPATVATAMGYWDFSHDAVAGGMTTPASTATLMTTDGGANGTMKALHVTGSNLTGWGAALAAEVSNGCPFDATAYGGISFWAKGTSTVLEGANKLLVLVGNPEFIPKANGGFCDDTAAVPADQNCYARHRVTITLTPEYKEYIVAWSDLKAPTYLTNGPAFGANRVRDIVFNASGPSPDPMPAAAFDFWIDELKFVPVGTVGNIPPDTGAAGAGAGGASGAGGAGGASAGAGGAAAGAGGAAAGSGGTAG